MSRAGRKAKIKLGAPQVTAIDGTEVKPGDIRVVNPVQEIPPDVLRAHRAQRVFMACKAQIIQRDRVLWPAEILGAAIADFLLQQAARRPEIVVA